MTISSVLQGASNLVKAGTGTLVLSGNNTYTGGTTLSAGTLSVGHANALGTGTGTIALNGGTIQSSDSTARSFSNVVTIGGNVTIGGTGNLSFTDTGTVALGANRTFTVSTSGTSATFAQSFTGSGNSITEAGSGTLILTGSNSGVTGGTTLTGGTLILSGATALPAGTLTWGTTGTTLRFENDANLSVTNTLATSIRGTNRTLVVDRITSGAAVNFSFSSTPNFDCGTVLNFQAGGDITSGTPTITFSNGTNSSDSNNGTIAGGTGNNGAIRFNPTGVNLVINGITSSGRTRGYILDGNSTGNRITGTWANGSGTEIQKDGTGTWTLAGTSNYTLTTTINNGTLKFERQTALYANNTANWTASNLRVRNGGTIAFNVGGTNEFTAGNITTLLTNLAASSSTTNGMNAGSRFGFDTTNASGGTFTIADVIADSTGASGGARGLTKLGTGTLILTNTNSYSGDTTVTGGTLLVSGSLAGTSAVNVGNTGTLGGSGGIINSAATVSVASGGTIAPGSSIGTLTTGPVSLASGSTFALEIDTTALTTDVLAINGNLSLASGGGTTLTISDLAPAAISSGTFTFITYTGGTWNGGLFTYNSNVIPDGGLLTVGSNQFTLDYDFGGNSVALLAVPEPMSYATLLGGLGTLALLRRRVRR